MYGKAPPIKILRILLKFLSNQFISQMRDLKKQSEHCQKYSYQTCMCQYYTILLCVQQRIHWVFAILNPIRSSLLAARYL